MCTDASFESMHVSFADWIKVRVEHLDVDNVRQLVRGYTNTNQRVLARTTLVCTVRALYHVVSGLWQTPLWKKPHSMTLRTSSPISVVIIIRTITLVTSWKEGFWRNLF